MITLVKAVDVYASILNEIHEEINVEVALWKNEHTLFDDYSNHMDALYRRENVVIEARCWHKKDDVLFVTYVDNKKGH